MRIAIVTSGRFHVLDLARELDDLGHEVAFYSYVPRARTEKFGLPRRCHRALLPYLAPLVAAQKFAPASIRAGFDMHLQRALDRLAARLIEPCDVFIGMSGLCIRSAEAARQKYEAKVCIERGSRHILSQKEILEEISGGKKNVSLVPDYSGQRELASYELADTIVVPSRHAKESFVERGFPESMLFRNPYGVDLSMFPLTPVPSKNPPTITNVGTWCLRKGCDVLTEALRMLKGVRLLHVGPVSDAPLPDDPDFVHHPPVEQVRLKDFYARAHVFVLASREEGLALVQAQALACGLPVVCTDRTGGEDLREFLDDPSLVTVVPHDDPDALADAIGIALARARKQSGIRDILGPAREKFSWRAYGRRYSMALEERVPLKISTTSMA